MSKHTVITECPRCKYKFKTEAEFPETTKDEEPKNDSISYPTIRANIKPISNVLVYKITSEQMKNFIIQKAKQHCPNVKVEVVPRYCEKKNGRYNNGPRHSYASLRIAFSDHVLERGNEYSYYEKIGETTDNIRFVNTIFTNLVQKYKYDPKDVDTWLSSYKSLEELEDSLGMNEAYINDIRKFSYPQRVKSGNEEWIIFAAACEKVIADMLSNPATSKVNGRLQIVDIYQVDKDVVEFIVYLHPTEIELRENPNVRKILLGEEKLKK